ncbi:hypothetical protein FF011L_32330 [Roseimaritima multifibrata]|uniref:PEP-CTERM protein-sorting domain-containing protein n=2 Tax=Roseimaritima multifibrata TaxID=1930274 RepID=A0A517MHV1_9BACT|nr:hypothetical protein FF011L_32330 [Roseimaritima multifibrata]
MGRMMGAVGLLTFGVFANTGLLATTAEAGILFSFENNSEFDAGAGPSTNMTRDGVTLQHVAFSYRDLDDAPSVGAIIHTGGSTRIDGAGGLGIDNPTLSAPTFQTHFGVGNETNNFNFDESWTFQFDQALRFDSIEFASMNTDDQFTVSIAPDTFHLGDLGNTYTDPFAGQLILAGQPITMTFSGNELKDQARILSFAVTPFTPTASAVPEPSTLSLLALLLIAGLRPNSGFRTAVKKRVAVR